MPGLEVRPDSSSDEDSSVPPLEVKIDSSDDESTSMPGLEPRPESSDDDSTIPRLRTNFDSSDDESIDSVDDLFTRPFLFTSDDSDSSEHIIEWDYDDSDSCPDLDEYPPYSSSDSESDMSLPSLMERQRKVYPSDDDSSASSDEDDITPRRTIAAAHMMKALPGDPDYEDRVMFRQGRDKRYVIADKVTNGAFHAHMYPVVVFGPKVILDSGASDHMTGDRSLLTNIEEYHIPVVMPDGRVVQCAERGLMRLAFLKNNVDGGSDPSDYHIIPLIDTLYVRGLHSHLVSIPGLNNSGITATFNTEHATINVNDISIVIDDPYHRFGVSQSLPFSAQMESQPARSPQASTPTPSRVSLELMHRRMGHRTFRSIVAADANDVWSGVKVDNAPEDYCVECKISGIARAKRGATPPAEAKRPGQVIFIDVQPNPAHGSLTSRTSFKFYLNIVCAYSRYFVLLGIHGKSSEAVIAGLERFGIDHKPWIDYTLKNDMAEIHCDADASFLSEEFIEWARSKQIKVVSAAPNHQEMNGLPERLWQTARVMAFKMMTNARVGLAYFHFAITYAWQILVVLPAKSTSAVKDGVVVPTTPHYLYFGEIPNVQKYRVFGCPAVCKVYKHKDSLRRTMDHKNIVQRGVRGIFVGFPVNQAGWLIYVPSSRHLLASADASFDEHFASVTTMTELIFHDSTPVHALSERLNKGDVYAHTGPPLYVPDKEGSNSGWAPYSALPPEKEADVVYEDELSAVDTFTNDAETSTPKLRSTPTADDKWFDVEEASPDYEALTSLNYHVQMMILNEPQDSNSDEETKPFDAEESDIDSSSNETIHEDYPSGHTSHDTVPQDSMDNEDVTAKDERRKSPRLHTSYANHMARTIKGEVEAIVSRDTIAIANTISEMFGEPGSDPSPFLPEPKDVWQVIRARPDIRIAWSKAICKEVKGLVKTKHVFAKETPTEFDVVIPIMGVFKCKLDKFGLIDKLKFRAVFRGDQYNPNQDIDSWNPHASWMALKVFLATCARRNMFPWQMDFIMACAQARMRERVFVTIPEYWKKVLPEDLHEWCGVPLLLLKALYGYTFSGKFLYEEQAEFLESQGFRQTSIVALWIKNFPNGSIILVLQYSDDFLAAGDNDEHNTEFKRAISERFDVEIHPQADWYLQARIRQDRHGNIVLDQQRYSKAIVRRYLPSAPSEPTERDVQRYWSPLPHGFKWTKADNSKTRSDVRDLEREYGFRYIEAVGSLNYLANTATEELFAIRKACRHMNLPGREHFKALLHLLHHLRCHPTNGIMFYKDWRQAPVYKMLIELGMKIEDGTLLWFTDASHGDCDESRSTCCSMGFYQGGLIDAVSFVPQPIPNSTAESETMGMAVGGMSCAYARKGIADVLFGDPDRPWTIPLMCDSQAAIAMNNNNRPTKRSRHIDRRYFFTRGERQAGRLSLHHIDKDYSLPDIGTKNLVAEESSYKLSIMEVPVSDHAIGTNDNDKSSNLPLIPRSQSKRGDGAENVAPRTLDSSSHEHEPNGSCEGGTHNNERSQDRPSRDHTHGTGINPTYSGTRPSCPGNDNPRTAS